MYVYKDMGSKTISIKDDAYERLKAHKREGESFSDVVLRLTDRELDVWTGHGALADRADDLRESHREARQGLDEGFEETREYYDERVEEAIDGRDDAA